jgi:hypothetical protein
VQRPRSDGWVLVCAVAYAYSFVFFTGTVVYAIVNSTSDYFALTHDLGALMSGHGAIMVIAGIGFGLAVVRAGVLPSLTGVARAAPGLAFAAAQAAPLGVLLLAAGIPRRRLRRHGTALLTVRPAASR